MFCKGTVIRHTMTMFWHVFLVISLYFFLSASVSSAETTPPTTTPSPIMGTYATTQNVTLTCSDGTGSGCAATWYCLGSGCTPTTPYSAPVAIESTTSLSFYSTDLNGNSEQVRTYAYTVDPTLAYRFERLWPQLTQPWYFNGPYSVAVDPDGNVYVADVGNNRIQKIDASGTFVTAWGGYGTANGKFSSPTGITLDPAGNVYVADSGNNRVQKFTASGEFLTAWGSAGIDPGQFSQPLGVAADSDGNIYVTESDNDRIQKFDSSGTFVTAWGSSGSGDGQLNAAQGITVDSAGNVYVADTGNSRIQKFDSDGTYLTGWGSQGSDNGQFFLPSGITIDSTGNIYVSDTYNQRIQKFSSNGVFVAAWGSEGSGSGQLSYPRGVTTDSVGNVYLADTFNHRIQKFDPNGTPITAWDSWGSGTGQFNNPGGITVMNTAGYVYVADRDNHRIQEFTSSGSFIRTWGSYGNGNGQFNSPQGIALDATGLVYVADTGNHRIQKFNSGGAILAVWGSFGEGDGQFRAPSAIAVDQTGNMYILDTGNNRVQKLSTGGDFISSWGAYGSDNGQFDNPKGIAVDTSGYVYVADSDNSRIQKFDANGTFITSWGSYGSGNGEFDFPHGITVDSAGFVYVTDTNNNVIQKFDSNGAFITAWGSVGSGNGEFISPYGIGVDSSNGSLFVADAGNNRIQKFNPPSLPGAPTGISATADYGQAIISFTPPTAEGSSAILFYRVTSIPGNITVRGDSSPITIAGLTGATSYTFTVAAVNAGGIGPASAPSNSVTPGSLYSLALTVSGSGTVNSSPAPDINCSGTCNQPYPDGTNVLLTASPNSGSTFSGWSGACSDTGSCSLTMGQDRAVTALFVPTPQFHALTMTVNGQGTVHSSPAPDINCTASCGQSYTSGTIVTLTATPGPNYAFASWSGACSGSTSCVVTMDQARTVTATFFSTGINGICGTAHNGQHLAAPTTGLCTIGIPSSVSGIGPWSWTCAGSGGGSDTSCSATQAGGAFYRSSDGGISWSGRATGIGFNAPIYDIKASPAYVSDHTLFLGAGGGTYRSTDNGDTWAMVHSGYSAQALAISPSFATDRTIFSGYQLSGIYKSSNGGTVWNAANTGLPSTQVRCFAVSPGFGADQTIFAGIFSNGVYKSTNGGISWSAANSGINTITPLSLAVSPAFATDQTIYAATTDGQYSGGGPHYHVYKSSNAGASWALSDTGLAGSISKLGISPAFATDHSLFAVTSSGIYKSSDSGASWVRVSTAVAGNSVAISPAYGSDQTLFAGIYGDNVYRSSNAGNSWSPSVSNFATVRQLSALAVSPAFGSDHTVFAAAYFAGPQLSVTPGSISFGNVKTGTPSTSRQVTISNGMFGDANLAISAITLSGTGASQYSVAPGSCATLTPTLAKSGSCTLEVTFTPTSTGSTGATLRIASNALSMPTLDIGLSGNGVTISSAISSPATGFFTNGTSVAVSGTTTCNDGCTVSLVEISSDGGVTWQTASGTSSWSAILPLTAVGTYTIRSRATTNDGVVESPGAGISITVERTPPTATLALYYGVWTLNANAKDGDTCLLVYPSICGTLEMSLDGSSWQAATTTPGTGGPLWLRDRAGNTAYIGGGSLANSNGGPIRIEGGSSTYYSLLQHALNAAANGDIIKLTTSPYSETLTLNTPAELTVSGGYNSSHSTVTGTTQVSGSLTVQAGTLTLENMDMGGIVSIDGGAVVAQSLTIL